MQSMVEGAQPLRGRCGRLAPSVGYADWLPHRGSN